MINQNLLNKELEFYQNKGLKLQPTQFSLKFIDDLFEKFNNYGMYEHWYCCYGEKQSCWTEILEEGNWDLTLEDIKFDIKSNIKHVKKYLYNHRKYGSRFYCYKGDDCCHIYIYSRDKVNADYALWFGMKNSI